MSRRDHAGLWQKGVSGNPGGRPKITAEVKELARQYTDQAIIALVKNLEDENGSVRNTAASILLDRGYGKPAQAIGGDDSMDAITLRTIVTGVPRPGDA